MEAVSGVAGRFEKVNEGQPFTVLVDYAHTPDSLQNVLERYADLPGIRILCGGMRRGPGPGQAAPNGSIAAENSDVVVFTSDNPRSEDPEAIIADMMEGLDAEMRERAVTWWTGGKRSGMPWIRRAPEMWC